jgi:hypothetical protein
LRAGGEVRARLRLVGENAGAFECDLHAVGGVRQVGGVALGGDMDAALPLMTRSLPSTSTVAGEIAVDAVALEQVGVGLASPRSLMLTQLEVMMRYARGWRAATRRPMRPKNR